MDPRTAKTPLFVTDGISWLGLVAGPLAWALDEEISYALADWSCHAQRPLLTYFVSVAALALIIAGAFLSWRDWQRRSNLGTADNEPSARARFLSLGGFALCLLFGMAVAIDAVAKFYFDPCQR
jgi:hypothetical protein